MTTAPSGIRRLIPILLMLAIVTATLAVEVALFSTGTNLILATVARVAVVAVVALIIRAYMKYGATPDPPAPDGGEGPAS